MYKGGYRPCCEIVLNIDKLEQISEFIFLGNTGCWMKRKLGNG